MTDRTAPLAAIRLYSDEDTPRLMFADYLDEFGTSDLDSATVEFIRLSCDSRSDRRYCDMMPRKVYPWLAANWKRLMPSMIALHCKFWGRGEDDDGRTLFNCPDIEKSMNDWEPVPTIRGRMFHVYVAVRPLYHRPPRYAATFGFRRGFCDFFQVSSRVSRRTLEPLVTADQPLCKFIGGT